MHEIFKNRHSTRSYLAKPIEKEKIEEILEAAETSPSAGNLKSRKIIAVYDEETKNKIVGATRNQTFISQAPVVLIFCAQPDLAEKYGQRGQELYCLQDATIAASFAWLQAVALGLSACWVGAFYEDQIREVLNLGDELKPIAILPIGYSQ